jgi:hypothetical protein
MKIAKKKMWLIIREMYNALTDIVVPLLSVMAVVLSVLPVPMQWLVLIKTAEEYCKKVGATKSEVERRLK